MSSGWTPAGYTAVLKLGALFLCAGGLELRVAAEREKNQALEEQNLCGWCGTRATPGGGIPPSHMCMEGWSAPNRGCSSQQGTPAGLEAYVDGGSCPWDGGTVHTQAGRDWHIYTPASHNFGPPGWGPALLLLQPLCVMVQLLLHIAWEQASRHITAWPTWSLGRLCR